MEWLEAAYLESIYCSVLGCSVVRLEVVSVNFPACFEIFLVSTVDIIRAQITDFEHRRLTRLLILEFALFLIAPSHALFKHSVTHSDCWIRYGKLALTFVPAPNDDT